MKFFGFTKEKDTEKKEEPSLPEVKKQLEELQKNKDFLLASVKTLIYFLQEFSFDLTELDADDFKVRLSQLYQQLAAENSLRSKEKLFQENKIVILDYIQREGVYFKEKEAEFKKIIELLLEGMSQVGGENREFNSKIYESNLRVEQISQLDDIRKIKVSLTSEVALMKKIVQEKQNKDESRMEGLAKEVHDLRNNLDKVQKASMLDTLTGAYNRLAFDTQINRMMENSRITGNTFSLLLCDLDFFKKINDTYGHLIGDRVLKAFVMECQGYFRQDDFISRYGGEEFAVLLPHASLKDAMKRAEKFCEIIAGKTYMIQADKPEEKLSFTVSIGVSCFRSGDTAEVMIERADKALYRAKNEGKSKAIKE